MTEEVKADLMTYAFDDLCEEILSRAVVGVILVDGTADADWRMRSRGSPATVFGILHFGAMNVLNDMKETLKDG